MKKAPAAPRLASRSGVSSPYGKRTEFLKSKVSEPVKAEIQRRCIAVGMSESEFIAWHFEAVLFGMEHAQSVHRARLEMVVGKVTERSQ